jgi:hypothetical protein
MRRYPVYHKFLGAEHVRPSFLPADISTSKHYLIVGGGPIGLVMAIKALLRGHRVTVVDSRKADRRDRYVGIWPKDIGKFTSYGLPECAWVVWTVLNATNDPAPVTRRNTSRLFLNISVAVRILTWSAVKLGAVILRGLFFDVRACVRACACARALLLGMLCSHYACGHCRPVWPASDGAYSLELLVMHVCGVLRFLRGGVGSLVSSCSSPPCVVRSRMDGWMDDGCLGTRTHLTAA